MQGAVPEDDVIRIGEQMGSFQNVSHCYRRPTYPDWPYNVFTMVHGQSTEQCEEVLRAISRTIRYLPLISSTEAEFSRDLRLMRGWSLRRADFG